ncbi:MAG: YceI family protein [Bacteroidetes bacterium]|nr:YceI family protein [Bacteroidota bacterium]
MKKTIYGVTVIGMIALSAFTMNDDIYKVDTKASSLEWTGKKLTGEHNGTILLSSGEITMKKDVVTGGKFEIDMTSIEDKDLSGEWKTKMDGHLKSADFFDPVKFPKGKFEIISATPIKDAKEGDFTHHVKGNLTIKEITNLIEFDAVIKMKGENIACVGTATIDRSKFDIKYGSKSFFPEIGDKIIYDEFTVKFNVVASK